MCRNVLYCSVRQDKCRRPKFPSTEDLEDKWESKCTLIIWLDHYVLTEKAVPNLVLSGKKKGTFKKQHVAFNAIFIKS